MSELPGGFGPLRERFGMDADFEVVAEDGGIFPEIEMGAEFGNCCVALCELCYGRWGEEPCGESVFSHAGAGEGEEFEETTAAKEVEVRGIETGMNVNAFACLAGAYPAIFDSGETAAVEGYSSLGTGALVQDSGVQDRDCEE